MSNKKERFGRWFIKNYWADIIVWIIIGLLIIGYTWYGYFIANWCCENNLGLIIPMILILAPLLIVLVILVLLSAYKDFKKTREK